MSCGDSGGGMPGSRPRREPRCAVGVADAPAVVVAEVLGVGLVLATPDDDERRHLLVRTAHSGMFPCFLGGRVSRFVRSNRRARMSSRRVVAGRMTAST